jgi:hypothetical protein
MLRMFARSGASKLARTRAGKLSEVKHPPAAVKYPYAAV